MRRLPLPALLPVLVLAGCAEFAPPPARDAGQPMDLPKSFAAPQSGDAVMAASLTALFNDPALSELVGQALANNHDVRLAARQMELAGYSAGIVGAALYPQANAGLQGSRTGRGAIAESSSASLDVSWEIDLWGRLRDSREAARADARAQAERLEAVRASIAAQVMQGWFENIRLTQAIALENRRLEVLLRSKDYLQENYRAGVGSLDDLAAIERDIALARDVILENQAARSQAARSLEVLLGQYPDGAVSGSARFPRLPPPPKADVPAAILAERPDLRQAWAGVEAADRRIKMAQKDLLPQISLTGSAGSASDDLGDLLSGATVWSLAGSLTAPVFDGNRRRTEVLASRNRADQAWITYLQSALTAFSEAERALDQEDVLRRRNAELNGAVKHAERTAALFRDRYQAGLASILEYLNAENAVFNIRSQRLAVQAQRLSNRVTLGLALGKGV